MLVRKYATAAGAGGAAATPASKMSDLMSKLSSIVDNGSKTQKQGMIKTDKRRSKFNPNNNNREKRENRDNRDNRDRSKSFNTYKKRNNDRNNRNRDGKADKKFERKGGRSFERRTVSKYDKFNLSENEEIIKPGSKINKEGLNFADYQEARALFIRRKLNTSAPAIELSDSNSRVLDFVYSRAQHRVNYYNKKSDKFNNNLNDFKYHPESISKADLDLSKDKIGYSTESRILQAIEILFNRRGFKLSDNVKNNVKYLPLTANLYPFANTTIPNSLDRPNANIENLSFSDIDENEIIELFDTVVKGKRPELVFNPDKTYPTEQMKINSQVVINALNSNAQLQVDNLHKILAQVFKGEKPLSELPQPVLPPKKI